ncbi:MAG: HNH endonuclease [Treponema sp.]|nr:HNH endonuclease [Treponema sp.]
MREAVLKDYTRYKALENGMILNVKTGEYMHQHSDGHQNGGYMKVKLTRDDGKRIHWFVSRFIYSAFYGVIFPKMQIDHKDGDRINNALDNLIMVTAKQNNQLKKQRDSNFLFNKKTSKRKKKAVAN